MGEKISFDKNTYKNEMNSIKLNKNQKEILLDKMREVDRCESIHSEDKVKTKKALPYIPIKAMAASLVVALLFSSLYIGFNNNTDSKNSFRLVASAAETGKLIELSKSEVIIGSQEGLTGYVMGYFDSNDYVVYTNKNGKKDVFSKFRLTDFKVIGTDIESVSMTANKKYTYFFVTPDYPENLYINENDTESSMYKAYGTDTFKVNEKYMVENYEAKNFSNFEPLTNSIYTPEEFKNYFFLGEHGTPCNGFTYKNTQVSDGEQTISLDYSTALILESDRTNQEIDNRLNNADKLYEEILNNNKRFNESEKNKFYFNSMDNKNLLEELSADFDYFEDSTLNNASINVSVKFKDGRVETQTLLLSCDDENRLIARLV